MIDPRLVTAFPQKPLDIDRAQGAHLYTADGRRIVDLGGASHGVANFGHNHPRIVRAVQEQAARLTHTTATLPSPIRRAFLDRLHDLLPDHLDRTFMANSGAEAVEAALKFAHAATGRSRFVALRNAFHGRTLGALAATARPSTASPSRPSFRASTSCPSVTRPPSKRPSRTRPQPS
jgi:LysW-gamma-L-lysine/LysW-L-ornithine aminotransferase